MRLAVVILTHNRTILLKRCLESISNQVNHSFDVNLRILVNGDDPETELFLEENDFPFHKLTRPIPVGEARNKLIEDIQEPLICFLDDDIFLPNDYFSKAQKFLENFPKAQMFGGPDQTPPDSSLFQATLGVVMKSYFATGPSNKRHGHMGGEVEEGHEVNLILCNFWSKSDVFKIKRFPTDFKRNEENYLLAILKDHGVRIYRLPELYVYHQRKTSIAKLGRTLFLAGVYRTVSICFYPRSARPLFFAHQLLCLLFALGLVLAPALSVILVVIYLVLITAESARLAAKRKKLRALPLAVILFMVFNLVYPIGQFAGYFKALGYFMRGKKF